MNPNLFVNLIVNGEIEATTNISFIRKVDIETSGLLLEKF